MCLGVPMQVVEAGEGWADAQQEGGGVKRVQSGVEEIPRLADGGDTAVNEHTGHDGRKSKKAGEFGGGFRLLGGELSSHPARRKTAHGLVIRVEVADGRLLILRAAFAGEVEEMEFFNHAE